MRHEQVVQLWTKCQNPIPGTKPHLERQSSYADKRQLAPGTANPKSLLSVLTLTLIMFILNLLPVCFHYLHSRYFAITCPCLLAWSVIRSISRSGAVCLCSSSACIFLAFLELQRGWQTGGAGFWHWTAAPWQLFRVPARASSFHWGQQSGSALMCPSGRLWCGCWTRHGNKEFCWTSSSPDALAA